MRWKFWRYTLAMMAALWTMASHEKAPGTAEEEPIIVLARDYSFSSTRTIVTGPTAVVGVMAVVWPDGTIARSSGWHAEPGRTLYASELPPEELVRVTEQVARVFQGMDAATNFGSPGGPPTILAYREGDTWKTVRWDEVISPSHASNIEASDAYVQFVREFATAKIRLAAARGDNGVRLSEPIRGLDPSKPHESNWLREVLSLPEKGR